MKTEQLEKLVELQQVDQKIQNQVDKIDTLMLLIESLVNREEIFEKMFILEEENENETRENRIENFFKESEELFQQLNLAIPDSIEKNLFENKRKELLKNKKTEENRLALLTEDYDRRSEKIDPDLLKMYKGIRSQGHTTAISPVKNGACQGCFINLPPQLFNELRNGNNYTICNTCQRIIFYASDE